MEIPEIKAALYKKPNDAVVMVTVNEFRGVIYIHIREHRLDGDTGTLFPTGKGYALVSDEIDTVIEALQEASEYVAQHQRGKLKVEEQYEFDFE